MEKSQMRPLLAVSLLLAACLVTSVAIAANDKVAAEFEQFAASGVTGSATLNEMPDGEVQIHAAIRGLQPGVEYTALVFNQSTTCGDGTPSFTIVHFQANKGGVATWNERVSAALSSIKSIGLRDAGNTLVACATVTL